MTTGHKNDLTHALQSTGTYNASFLIKDVITTSSTGPLKRSVIDAISRVYLPVRGLEDIRNVPCT